MMALHPGGRPGSSRRVRLVPVRQSGMDHRAVARIVLAMARQMATDEAVEPEVDDAASSDAVACSKSERRTAVGRCAANEPVSASAGSGLAGRCSHQRHEGAHYLAHGTSSATSHVLPDRVGTTKTDDDAAPSSTSGGIP